MPKNIFIHSSLILALAFSMWSAPAAIAAETAPDKTMMDGKMMKDCQDMQMKKQKMMADMKAQDGVLNTKCAAMNGAPDDKKTALMADVITCMADQRMTRDAGAAKMEAEMMKHMMEHMQMGKESMATCPMMKDMSGMKDMKGMDNADMDHHPEKK
jgi:hypothetical protein